MTVSCRCRASDLSEDGDPWINASSHPGDAGELGGSGRTELLRAERLRQKQQQLHGAQSLGPLPGAHRRGHLLQRGALEPKRLVKPQTERLDLFSELDFCFKNRRRLVYNQNSLEESHTPCSSYVCVCPTCDRCEAPQVSCMDFFMCMIRCCFLLIDFHIFSFIQADAFIVHIIVCFYDAFVGVYTLSNMLIYKGAEVL